jgi:PleD family two-component response regulator
MDKLGYALTLAPSGDVAWELYQHSPFRFVITEYDLPGLDGPELCRRIRNENHSRHTYVMFYAARNDSDIIVEAYHAGADDFLAKPFNLVLLDLRLSRGKQELNREDDLRIHSNHDDTTGFIKFNTFMRFFAVHDAGARRHSYQGIVTFATIENFDDILSNHGYGLAKQTKSVVASVLGSAIRSSDLVAHAGEDSRDFCTLMPDMPRENVGIVVRRIESQLRNAIIHTGKAILRPRLEYSTVIYPNAKLTAEQSLEPQNRVPFKLDSAA